jgi:hypothetical protein
MEHAIHLGAGHFISHVGPTASSKVMKKVRAALKKAQAGSDQDAIDLDELDLDLTTALDGDNAHEGDMNEDEFDIADTVGKALGLVTQVIWLCIPILKLRMLPSDSEIPTSSCVLQADLR